MQPRLTLHGLPLRDAWVSRRGATRERWSLIVRLGADEETGFGEAPLPLRVTDAHEVARAAARTLPAELPSDLAAARDLLSAAPLWLRHGVLCALLDHEARQQGVTFLEQLAHPRTTMLRLPRRSEVKLNGNIGPVAPQIAADAAGALVAAGFTAAKVKSLGDVSEDVARIGAIRDAVGDALRLRLDVNGAWSVQAAEAALLELARFELEYVEQPIEAPDPQTARRLADASSTPVAWDESVTDVETARWLTRTGCAALVVKPPRLGGPDVVLDVIEVAAERDVPCVVSTPLEGTIGRTADLHLASVAGACAHGLATGAVFAREDVAPILEPHRGSLRVPEGPGLGVRFRVERGETVSRGRD